MNAIRRTLRLTTASALAVMLGACGGGPTEPPPPTPTPAPTPRPAVVLDRGDGQLPNLVALVRPLATTETGAFDVTVDWTFATNDIDVGLARGNCSFEQFIADQCAFAAESTSTTAKPERLRLANQPAGTYTLVVVNFGPEDESISYQVVFTPGTAAASASHGAPEARVRKAAQLLRGIVKVE
jgi:hypothetical protein